MSRILILTVVITALMTGLFSPVSSDALLERLTGSNDYVPEINALTSRGLHDCTVESSTMTQHILGTLERRNSSYAFARFDSAPDDNSYFALLSLRTLILLAFFLAGLSCYSVSHITYIHSQDGFK